MKQPARGGRRCSYCRARQDEKDYPMGAPNGGEEVKNQKGSSEEQAELKAFSAKRAAGTGRDAASGTMRAKGKIALTGRGGRGEG